MSTKRDKPHILILTGDGEEREWRIIHPATCPWDAYRSYEPEDAPFLEQKPTGALSFHRCCLTQFDIDANGIDSLDCYHLLTDEQKAMDWLDRYPDWKYIPAGRYAIECWSSWSGSWYDEADGGMELVEDVVA